MEGDALFEEVKEGFEEVYVAYCKKDKEKGTPVSEWVVNRNLLDEHLLNNIAGCMKFILELGFESEKVYLEEVSKGDIIEIDHPEPSKKKISIRKILENIISVRGIKDLEKKRRIFEDNAKIIAMKYLKTTYSRSYALIIIPFTAFGESYVIIFSCDLIDLRYPIISDESGLAIQILSKALKVKMKGEKWIPLKIALYPALYQGERKEGFIKLYDEYKTAYWRRLFETLTIPPKTKRLEVFVKMLEISMDKYRTIPTDVGRNMMEIQKTKETVELDELAKILGIEETEEYVRIKEDISSEYIPSIKSEDLDVHLLIEGRDFLPVSYTHLTLPTN